MSLKLRLNGTETEISFRNFPTFTLGAIIVNCKQMYVVKTPLVFKTFIKLTDNAQNVHI